MSHPGESAGALSKKDFHQDCCCSVVPAGGSIRRSSPLPELTEEDGVLLEAVSSEDETTEESSPDEEESDGREEDEMAAEDDGIFSGSKGCCWQPVQISAAAIDAAIQIQRAVVFGFMEHPSFSVEIFSVLLYRITWGLQGKSGLFFSKKKAEGL